MYMAINKQNNLNFKKNYFYLFIYTYFVYIVTDFKFDFELTINNY